MIQQTETAKYGAVSLFGGTHNEQSKVDKPLNADNCSNLSVHAIKGKDFGPAARKMIARNVDAATLQQLEPKIEIHSQMYEDV